MAASPTPEVQPTFPSWDPRHDRPSLPRTGLARRSLGYAMAAAAAAAGLLAWKALTAWAGPGLPPFITFFPFVLATALFGGFGPGVLATVLAGLAADIWILPPVGRFSVASPVDRLGLALFLVIGLALSLTAGLHRRNRDEAAAYERQAALRESELRFRTMLEQSRDVIYSLNLRTGRYEYISPAAEALFGFTPEELMAMDAQASAALVHPEDLAALAADWGRVDQAGRGELEYRQRTRDGGYRWISNHMATSLGSDGLPLFRHGNLRDITEYKRMEDSLREDARRKDDFLALLGHELRNPLAPVGNAVYLIKRSIQDRGLVEEACAIIERQLAHIVRLVDDLLDISRFTRGKVSLRLEPVDLVEAVQAVAADHRAALAAAGLRLGLDLPGEPVRVLADRARIIQAVSNLVHNAIKFTDRGGSIGVAVDREGTRWGTVRVRDSGMGIPSGQLEEIFEPFTQGRESIGRSPSGLGLGLALVKAMAALHGGSVCGHSEGPGRGAEFVLRLPRTGAPHRPGPPPGAPETGRPSVPRRILVVEDLADTAKSTQLLLQSLGHQVEVAFDGPAGLAKAEAFVPDLVLCDIGLPGAMDGYSVARALRAHPRLKDVVLIAISGFGAPDDKRRADLAGFDAHLTKPVRPEDLDRIVTGISR
jgi:PAS domain S-box-containing protein